MWENTPESIFDRIDHILRQGEPDTNSDIGLKSRVYWEDLPEADQEFIDALFDQYNELKGKTNAN